MGWALAAVLAINLAGLAVVYLLLRSRTSRTTAPERQSAELRDEVARLVVELNQATDRNVALLEDRLASLNELLATADKKLGLLRREIEHHDAATRRYGRLQPPPAASRPKPDLAEEPSHGTGAPGAEPAVRRPDRVAAREEVARLARAGFSSQLIASRVGLPLGEVELIISLGRGAREE